MPNFENEYNNSSNKDLVYFTYRSFADTISEDILNEAIIKGLNITWETTGNNVFWAIKTIELMRKNGYFIFLVYPFVSTKELLERVNMRANKSISEGKVGRKPDETRIRDNIMNAQINFEKLYPFVDKLAIYDNTKNIEELNLLIEIEKDYLGYCEKKKKGFYCKDGINYKLNCENFLESKTIEFQVVFKNFLENECKLAGLYDPNHRILFPN
jgi:predicted ABC-type ATPase